MDEGPYLNANREERVTSVALPEMFTRDVILIVGGYSFGVERILWNVIFFLQFSNWMEILYVREY